MTNLQTLPINQWHSQIDQQTRDTAIHNLENDKVLFLPQLAFAIHTDETHLLSPDFSNHKAKNISYSPKENKLKGVEASEKDQTALKKFLQRYAEYSTKLVKNLFPHYEKNLQLGKTSFRPVEAQGRQADSYKKDDTRLHIDAFPSNPNQGKRILRVFCNINPDNKPRVWHIGEPFSAVAKRFAPKISMPFPGSTHLMKFIKITKSLRTPYDHYMLNIHDLMKGDEHYQKNLIHEEIAFPAQSTWIVFSDSVSHAALSGQHLLEQTFYLPAKAMQHPEHSPLRILEKLLNRELST